MTASIKIHIPRDVARVAGFPLHGDCNYEPKEAELQQLDPTLVCHLPQFSTKNVSNERLTLESLEHDVHAEDLIWPAFVRALQAHALQLTDTRRQGIQVLEQWARLQSLWPELRRGAEEGYSIASNYIALVCTLICEHDLQLRPVPEAFVMAREVFHSDYVAELRHSPSMYAFTVRDRLVTACATLKGELAKGTGLTVSPVVRCTPPAGGADEQPFTAVVVEVSHPGAAQPACVVFTAE